MIDAVTQVCAYKRCFVWLSTECAVEEQDGGVIQNDVQSSDLYEVTTYVYARKAL
jgi:hypothetical protein